jgi:hypothetical protein
VALVGLYGFDMDELRALTAALGSFEVVFFYHQLLNEKEEIAFLRYLYSKHIAHKENTAGLFRELLSWSERIVTETFSNLDLDALKKLAEDVISKLPSEITQEDQDPDN